MEINPGIFKSYDIRGVYPSELDEETAYEIGRAFARQTKVKEAVVGQDSRLASLKLFLALVQGLLAEGVKATNIGQVPTECLYFAVGNYNFPAGIMITASHNPKEYDGFKMMENKGGDIQLVRGKDLLANVHKSGEYNKDFAMPEIEKKDFWNDFVLRMLGVVDLAKITPMKIVVDASNGVAGHMVSRLQDKLPVETIQLNFAPDGNFPNHAPNPLLPGSTDQIKAEILSKKADVGFIFDGDADRIFVVDENGELVRADVVLLMMAKYFLEKNPGMAIAYNAICSKAVPDFVKKWGGLPVKTQVGFINVREGLLKNNGIMGGELSGHYCFKDNYFMDSGLIAMLTLLEIISQENKKVSEIAKELSPYAKGAETNFEVADKQKYMDMAKEKYADGKQDFLDGITVEYSNWWFNLRPSNTEPLLRLTIEADTPEILAEKQKELAEMFEK